MSMKTIVVISAALSAFSASADITITDVTARQRWPWNTLVDVDFTISGAPESEAFAVDLSAEYADGSRKIAAYSYACEPIAKNGANRIIWNFGQDYPDLHADDLRISVTATPLSQSTPLYMVIDLSGGKDATAYPVRYTTVAPTIHDPAEDLAAALADKCRTTELWLRRIPAAGKLGSTDWRVPQESNNHFAYRFTKDFYMAIFETTQGQWYQLTGNWIAAFSNETYRAVRPLESVIMADVRGQWKWPDDRSVTDGSVLKKLRDRTGIATIDLPTSAQFTYASYDGVTGTGKELYYGRRADGTKYTLPEVARYAANSGSADGLIPSDHLCDLSLGTACVGSYQPNMFGLYDMVGNAFELVLDPYAAGGTNKLYYAENVGFPVVDPPGLPQTYAKEHNGNKLRNTIRGGGWSYSSGYCTMSYALSAEVGTRSVSKGFRFCVVCE